MKFEDVNVDVKIAQSIQEMGFTDLTEIQELAIPYLLESEDDFVGQAQTGTGKTAAFSIPLLQKINPKSKDIQALVLVPTRELALQVHQEVEKLAKHTGIKSQVIQGGVSYDRQISGIKKKQPQIIVGTPGRIIDLIKRKVLKFGKTQYVVLDEADEMLNMGFLEPVQEIFSLVSQEKKIWMFSATMPTSIRSLIKKEFNNPHVVAVKKQSLSSDNVEQRYYTVHESKHLEALCRILDSEPKMYGIIFCRTRVETKEVYEELMTRGYAVETLHGDLGQNLRDAAMAKFKKKKVTLMICTDVAARGIDVNNLTHVVNYGLPQDSESYVHRIGRTGRAGMQGVAITIIDPRATSRLRRIESMIKKQMTHTKLPSVSELKKYRIESELQGMTNIVEAVIEKGENFKTDSTFQIFNDAFAEMSKEEILKTMFTTLFTEELRHYDSLGALNEEPRSQKKSESRRNGKTRKDRRRENLVSLFVNQGKKDGLHLKLFLREFSKQTGVRQDNIHNIRLNPQYSSFDVPSHISKKLMQNKNITLLKKKVTVDFAR